MDKDFYLETFRANTDALIAAAHLGLEPPVPSCPGWTVADLVGHIGMVDWAWAHHIENRVQEPAGRPPLEFLDPYPGVLDFLRLSWESKAIPADAPPNLIDWYSDGAARLEATFRDTDLNEPIWHWSGDNRLEAHLRMQAMETTVHRWDAENAHGSAHPVDLQFAREGIDQFMDVMVPARRKWHEPRTGAGESYHLHCTDGPGEWLIRFEGDAYMLSREHAKADAAVRGSAPDLFLFLWGRKPASELDVVGDAALLERLPEFVPPA